SWLQTIVSSAGATTQITYLPFPRTQSSAREPARVVTKIATTGPGLANVSGTRTAANAQYYSYANLQAPGHPWNDPQRLEPFGFADTYVQDEGSLQVVHTTWGGDHITAGRQTSVAIGTSTTLFQGAVPDGTVQYYATTQHHYAAKPIGAVACLASPPSAAS